MPLVLVGTAFTVMASLLLVHGFASPGFIVEMNGVVSLTGAATLPVGGVILALSALPSSRGPRAVRRLLWLQAALMVGVLALGLLALWLPQLVPSVPEPASFPAIATLVLGLGFYGLLAMRALHTVLLTRRRADLGVFVGLVWLAGALLRLLAQKDMYTEGHTRRVARLAVDVGEELGLPPSRLRELATGGLLHDIGKLAVPDAVLKKPAALDDAEYALVQKHAVWGDALVGRLGFSAAGRRPVRDHHERLDGSGYPHGSTTLSLETRVLAVCDVYDALRSERVYRAAWTHARAIGLLHEEAGDKFDGRCVEALERVLERDHAAALAVAV